MTSVELTITFDEHDVQEWCDQANDSNSIHLSAEEASESVFGERVVPGMMILDQVSGLVEQYGATRGGTAVLTDIVAVRFRDPIPFDEDVTIRVSDEPSEESDKKTTLDFTAETWDGLAVHGTILTIIT